MDKTTDTSASLNASSNHCDKSSSSSGGGGGGCGGSDTIDGPTCHNNTLAAPPHCGVDKIGVGCGPSASIAKTTTALPLASTSLGAAASASASSSSSTGASAAAVTAAAANSAIPSILQAAAAQHSHPTRSAGIAFPIGTITPIKGNLQHMTPPKFTVPLSTINLNISTTTGTNFGVTVDPQISVENLKKIITKKLKVAKDRICLLHREKELQDGTLKDNNLMDGSKIILIPNVETGLLAQRPENTVMQALESLNDSQVNDFLSGKTPLNLSMRLGDHMMLIQLQLSTVNPVNSSSGSPNGSGGSSSRTRTSQRLSRSAAAASVAGATGVGHHNHHHHHHHHHHHGSAAGGGGATSLSSSASSSSSSAPSAGMRKMEVDKICLRSSSSGGGSLSMGPSGASANTTTTTTIKSSDLSSFLSKRDYESLQNIVKSLAIAQPSRLTASTVRQSTAAQSVGSASTPTPTTICPSSIAMMGGQKPSVRTTVLPSPSPASSSSTTSSAVAASATATNSIGFHAAAVDTGPNLLEQSPIKSLSNLVSSPIKTAAIQNIPIGTANSGGGGNSAHTNTTRSSNSNSPNNGSSSSSGPATLTIPTVAITPAPPLSSVSSPSSSSPSVSAMLACQDPIAAKLTSCLCTRLNGGGGAMMASGGGSSANASAKSCIESLCSTSQGTSDVTASQPRIATILTSTPNDNYKSPSSASTSSSSVSLSMSPSAAQLHKTANNQITRSKHRHHHHHHHHHHYYHHVAGGSRGAATSLGSAPPTKLSLMPRCPSTASIASSSTSNDSGFMTDDSASSSLSPSPSALASVSATASAALSATGPSASAALTAPAVAANSASPATNGSNSNSSSSSTSTPIELDDSGFTVSDTRALAEASRNLTQTLRKLSKEVFTNKIDLSGGEETPRKGGSGAVIESMKNHGKGIYSGTFSGTLNPALQDRYGRPKRDISTVIHILNDLLSATPQYSRGARISFETPSTSTGAAGGSSGPSSGLALVCSSRNKQLSSKHHQHAHSCLKCLKAHQSQHGHHTVAGGSSASGSGSGSGNGNHHSTAACTYGECNGHYSKSSIISKSSYACCQDLPAGSAAAAAAASAHGACGESSPLAAIAAAGDRNVCSCRYRTNETGEREREVMCQKCLIEMENLKTKSKLDQIRLVMQQRKQKREARKLKGAPYGARVVGATTATVSASATTTAMSSASSATLSTATTLGKTGATTAPTEVSPSHIVEEVDTAA